MGSTDCDSCKGARIFEIRVCAGARLTSNGDVGLSERLIHGSGKGRQRFFFNASDMRQGYSQICMESRNDKGFDGQNHQECQSGLDGCRGSLLILEAWMVLRQA